MLFLGKIMFGLLKVTVDLPKPSEYTGLSIGSKVLTP